MDACQFILMKKLHINYMNMSKKLESAFFDILHGMAQKACYVIVVTYRYAVYVTVSWQVKLTT